MEALASHAPGSWEGDLTAKMTPNSASKEPRKLDAGRSLRLRQIRTGSWPVPNVLQVLGMDRTPQLNSPNECLWLSLDLYVRLHLNSYLYLSRKIDGRANVCVYIYIGVYIYMYVQVSAHIQIKVYH